MAMIHARCARVLICAALLASSAALSQVCLIETPLFAEAGHDISIEAAVDGAPKDVTLSWTGSTGPSQTVMTADGDGNRWTGVIPGQAVEGSALTYTVTATYDDGSAAGGGDRTLSICPAYTIVEPQALALWQKVLVENEWNSAEAAFGLLRSPDGPPQGPASIASENGVIYVLDSVNCRVLGFTKDGRLCATIPVPTSNASDLVIDPTDGSVIVISQLDNKVYEFQDGQLTDTRFVSMKETFEYPALFSYDGRSGKLCAPDPNHRERLAYAPEPALAGDAAEQAQPRPVVTDVQGQNLIVKTNSRPDVFVVPFDRPVGYIDEAVTDGNGIVWVLYTLEGDYRSRRLVRIDTLNARAETSPVDVWFGFDGTRRMTVTDTGAALLTGDASHGRIVTFDYAGDLQ